MGRGEVIADAGPAYFARPEKLIHLESSPAWHIVLLSPKLFAFGTVGVSPLDASLEARTSLHLPRLNSSS